MGSMLGGVTGVAVVCCSRSMVDGAGQGNDEFVSFFRLTLTNFVESFWDEIKFLACKIGFAASAIFLRAS